MSADPIVSRMGEAGFLLEAAGPLNDADQHRVWSLARTLEAWPDVREIVPAVNNILVMVDPAASGDLEPALRRAWSEASIDAPAPGKEVVIPVRYGGEGGTDLADVAARAGLSVDEVVTIHSEGAYRVFAIGAAPGFCYLSGLDPRLRSPRRDVPRTRVEAGSVMVGGAQTGIMPIASPSGWHVLGLTSLALFDVAASPPALLAPGDRVRFAVESFVP